MTDFKISTLTMDLYIIIEMTSIIAGVLRLKQSKMNIRNYVTVTVKNSSGNISESREAVIVSSYRKLWKS